MFKIVAIGKTKIPEGCDAIGGDRCFLKVGLDYEIVGPGPDGGPVLLAVCPNLPAAQAIKLALELILKG